MENHTGLIGKEATMTAKTAYGIMIAEVMRGTENPTYELCQPTIENMVGNEALFDMVTSGLIEYVGRNHNGIRVFKIR
jgi:hypothetical protein